MCGKPRHPSTTLWHPQKTHTAHKSALAIELGLGPEARSGPDGLFSQKKGYKSKVIGVRDLTLTEVCMWQIRHPSTTLWHPYKTHSITNTTHKSALAIELGLGPEARYGPDGLFSLKKGYTSKLIDVRDLMEVCMWQIRHPSTTLYDTLTRLTLHTSQPQQPLNQGQGKRHDMVLMACSHRRKGINPR